MLFQTTIVLLLSLYSTFAFPMEPAADFPVIQGGSQFVCTQRLQIRSLRNSFKPFNVDSLLKRYGMSFNDFIVVNPHLVPISKYSNLAPYTGTNDKVCVSGYWRKN